MITSGLSGIQGLESFVRTDESAGKTLADAVMVDSQADVLQATVQASSGVRYFSPVVRLDAETQKVVLLYRDPETGDVVSQYPSEKQLRAYGESQKLANPEAPALFSGLLAAQTKKDSI